MKPLNRGASRGFTLVELVLVLTIAGVLATVAVPRMFDRSAFQTHGAAAEIRTALRYAQKLAMAKNREVCVTTTPAPDLRLSFSLAAGGPCNQQVIRPGGGQNPDGSFDYVATPPAGITLTSGAPVFRFDVQGRPITSPPNTVLVAPVDLTVGGTITISVLPETGYVQ